MSTTSINLPAGLASGLLCLGVGGFCLAACAAVPSTTEIALLTPTSPPYPISEATSIVLTLASIPGAQTPAPDEQLVVGTITEVPAPMTDLGYSLRKETITSQQGNALGQIYIQYLGQETQLGDVNGSSHVEAASQQFLIWRYIAHITQENSTFRSGLYLHEVATGKNTLIVADGRATQAEFAAEWVIYTSWASIPRDTQMPKGEDQPNAQYGLPLIGYNIASGQTITFSANIPWIMGRDPVILYDITDQRLGWIEYDRATGTYAIKLQDLKTKAVTVLAVVLDRPRFFSLSEDLAIWRNSYGRGYSWQGYSLTHQAQFTIPMAPPGWEKIASILVTAKPSGVEWLVDVSETERRYFSAPVIHK